MNVLITGSSGFIGKNLLLRLSESKLYTVFTLSHNDKISTIKEICKKIDIVFHLAGVNRPENSEDYMTGNVDFTKTLCQNLIATKRKIPLIVTSSIQITLNNPYGISKKISEQIVMDYSNDTGSEVFIYRLPNVFGKWCKPNYNSVVATFCYNLSNNLPIVINDSNKVLELVYIDDVIETFLENLKNIEKTERFPKINIIYKITLTDLVHKIEQFKNCRSSLIIENVGIGIDRALYSTYLSYLKPNQFSYKIPEYSDNRGTFYEILKTKESGQFSFFSAYPGITRGGHYHHTKTEKFLVVKGKAKFKFKNLLNDEIFELFVNDSEPIIVETIPGWVHDISNVGDETMFVFLWANEIFDRDNPDTYNRLM